MILGLLLIYNRLLSLIQSRKPDAGPLGTVSIQLTTANERSSRDAIDYGTSMSKAIRRNISSISAPQPIGMAVNINQLLHAEYHAIELESGL